LVGATDVITVADREATGRVDLTGTTGGLRVCGLVREGFCDGLSTTVTDDGSAKSGGPAVDSRFTNVIALSPTAAAQPAVATRASVSRPLRPGDRGDRATPGAAAGGSCGVVAAVPRMSVVGSSSSYGCRTWNPPGSVSMLSSDPCESDPCDEATASDSRST
jgi:hypothetical protein